MCVCVYCLLIVKVIGNLDKPIVVLENQRISQRMRDFCAHFTSRFIEPRKKKKIIHGMSISCKNYIRLYFPASDVTHVARQ